MSLRQRVKDILCNEFDLFAECEANRCADSILAAVREELPENRDYPFDFAIVTPEIKAVIAEVDAHNKVLTEIKRKIQ